jgi:hypothetical protein
MTEFKKTSNIEKWKSFGKIPDFFSWKSSIKISPGFEGCVHLPGLAISSEVDLQPK